MPSSCSTVNRCVRRPFAPRYCVRAGPRFAAPMPPACTMGLPPGFATPSPPLLPKTSFLAVRSRLPGRRPSPPRRRPPPLALPPPPTRCVGGGVPPSPSTPSPPPPPNRPPGGSTPPSAPPPPPSPPPADPLRDRLAALTLPPRGGVVDYLRTRRPRTRLQYVLLRAPFDAVDGAEEYLR